MPVSQSWIGGSPATAKVNTYTFAGTWVIGETVTVTVGNEIFIYTITSATIATFLPLLLAAIQALSSTTYPATILPSEIVWTGTASTIVATSGTAGVPFIATLSTNSALGTINGGASSVGTATVANAGPASFQTAANWSGGTVPAAGDTLILDLEGGAILWDLDLHTVTVALVRCVANQFKVGLPQTNANGYPEYRATSLMLGITTAYVNAPKSGRIKLDFGSIQTACTIDATGNGLEQNIPALLLKGTHASNAYFFNAGSIGVGFFASVAYTILTAAIGAKATVTLGAGGTVATTNNYGGAMTCYCAIATALNHPTTAAARSTLYGAGAIAQITIQGGTVDDRGTGTIGGNTLIGGAGLLTMDGGTGAITITNPILLESAQAGFSDAYGRVSGGYTIKMVNCIAAKVGIKANSQLIVSSLSLLLAFLLR